MSNITAKMVAELREITGLGMMECKKALVEAEGVIAKAEELLRIKSGAKANKVAGRIAADGAVAIFISDDAKNGALVEVNCETDFVAKDANFLDFTNAVAKAVVGGQVDSVETLSNVKLAGGKTVEETRKEIIAKIGENISVRRLKRFSTSGVLANYLHGKKIGVVIDLAQGDIELGKDLAMHIAASKPVCVSANEVPSEKIEAERNIYAQQAAQSGKAPEIVNKMVEGRINKFLAEITLMGQPFVKNPDMMVGKLLASKNAKVNAFTMFVVGDGIEKKVVDFQAEVAEAVAVASK